MTIDNILATYARATPQQIHDGERWYWDAYNFARRTAHRHGLRTPQVAWITAALSPQVSWGENKYRAEILCKYNHVYGFKANMRKAQRLLAGEHPHDVIPDTSRKVRNFGTLIANPRNKTAVCVDRHAADLALGRATDAPPLPAGFLTEKRYNTIADAYRLAALQTPHTPAQVQAITWLVRRSDKWSEGAWD